MALLLVAGLTLLGQFLVQQQLTNQENDSWLINRAGQQRFRSQSIMKNALLLTMPLPQADNKQLRDEQANLLFDWKRYHTQLSTGKLSDIGQQQINSDGIRAMFRAVQPHFDALQTSTHILLDKRGLTLAEKQQLVSTMLPHERQFLVRMDQIVQQYQLEAQQKVDTLRHTEWALLLLTLLVLLLEARLIFGPVVKMVRTMIMQLTTARQQTEQANELLLETNEAMKETQQQLLHESVMRHQQQLSEQRIRMGALVLGQEEERRRLSHDLHDGIGQMLTGLKLLAENLRSVHLLPDNEQCTYASLKALVVKIIQETRHVSNNLMPPVLSDFGLEPALRYIAEQMEQQSGLVIQVHSEGSETRLDPNMEIGLYRIVQEALTNVIKHADASDVDIDLRIQENRLLLSVADNGRGVGTAQADAILAGQGLHNMRQRARLMNGVLHLSSQPDQGTRIVVTIPLGSTQAEPLSVLKKAKKVKS